MLKPNKKLLLFLCIAVLVLVISCAKPECRASSDCASRKCFLPKCEDNKCSYAPQKNCCGNRLNDSIEDGKPGDKCTCPQDYGACGGKGKITRGARTEDAVYVRYYCNADLKCVFGVDEADVASQNYPDTINPGFFKASSVAKYNKPFDAGNDIFEFRVSLDDTGKDLVLPVMLTKVKLLYSGEYSRAELLIAELEIGSMLNGIGDYATISLPLNLGYRPQQLEESGSIRYSIDYAYTRQVLSGKTAAGANTYSNETKRETFTAPAKPVFFVRSG